MNIVLLEKDERTLSRGDERFQHIRKVLHKGVGDSFHCGIVNSFEGNARIVSLSDEEMELEFTPSFDSSALYPLTVIVAQVRPICMKRILREAVSMGVEKLILPISDLGEKSYSSSSLYRDGEYRSILLDGAAQSGKTGVSECILTEGVEKAIEEAGEGEKLLMDNVIGAVNLSSLSLQGKRVILAIGPERGWSERERDIVLSSGFSPVLLGSRILRTETAAVAGPAVALTRMGLI